MFKINLLPSQYYKIFYFCSYRVFDYLIINMAVVVEYMVHILDHERKSYLYLLHNSEFKSWFNKGVLYNLLSLGPCYVWISLLLHLITSCVTRHVMIDIKATRKLSRIDLTYTNVACSCDILLWLKHIFQRLGTEFCRRHFP
jgi:hypothetical protein